MAQIYSIFWQMVSIYALKATVNYEGINSSPKHYYDLRKWKMQ